LTLIINEIYEKAHKNAPFLLKTAFFGITPPRFRIPQGFRIFV